MSGGGGNKRSRTSSATGQSEEKKIYYDRLIHQCRKDLHKQAKICKSFECQKLIRKLKPKPSNDRKQIIDDEEQTGGANSINSKDNLLREIKEVPLECVIDECFRQLGILQLNPSAVVSDGSAREKERMIAPSAPSAGVDFSKWIMRILQHKRMKDCVEKWSQEVTKYRRWNLRRDERQQSNNFASGGRKRIKRDGRTNKGESAKKQAEQLSNSLFLQLGVQEEDEGRSEHGAKDWFPGSDGDDQHYGSPAGTFAEKKRNRPGQRARKAKAMAIQARKEGRFVGSSVNWRPKKKTTVTDDGTTDKNDRRNHKDHSHNGTQFQKPGLGAQGSSGGKSDDEPVHPSWQAARQKQTAGIVAFQGTKITFD